LEGDTRARALRRNRAEYARHKAAWRKREVERLRLAVAYAKGRREAAAARAAAAKAQF
jgi:hypothetical protein